jgi:hypothetical protein
MLWFFHAGDAKYDPMYGVYRRSHLVRNHFPFPSERTDWLAVTELALAGPILNIPERLAHRTRDYVRRIDRAAFRRRLDPALGERLNSSASRLCSDLESLAASAALSRSQLSRCKSALWRFWIKEQIRQTRTQLSDARRQLFGVKS